MTITQDLLPDDLSMGTVLLKVGDLPTMSNYYQRALGLEIIDEASDGLRLGRTNTPLIHLAPAAGLQLPAQGEAGLFHTALLFDDRSALAATVAATAQYDAGLYVGSADHLVSEAFYFTDPEGNGIELYFDKPRETWQWSADGSGQATGKTPGKSVVMDSLRLPADAYLRDHLTEAAVTGQAQARAAVGHVHLQVGDVETAGKFYVDTLGFERTAGWHGQALFVSAGGYHHHMAMNVWNSRGAGPRKDTLGLGEVLIRVTATDHVDALADRLRGAGITHHHTGSELRFNDPWNNKIRVAVG
ncbi:VOC family protein [Arthrobacter sp. CAN_C5]|uniref:VOC family protein n=1 Tax=Arthrobacter sp. CAN_C5 TaxID=2760706 RepID=UPI001AE4775D|nr:VOC family protein [Arthrobacter sp. CAN_C5]MBP2216375.1 catechol 2,3-dioxygenase [Arthrobacter sp. CAN_C5]